MARHTFSVEAINLQMLTHLNFISAMLISVVAETYHKHPDAWIAIKFQFLPADDCNKKKTKREVRIFIKGINKKDGSAFAYEGQGPYFTIVKRESLWDLVWYMASTLEMTRAAQPNYEYTHTSIKYSDDPGSFSSPDRGLYDYRANESNRTFIIDYQNVSSGNAAWETLYNLEWSSPTF